MTERDRFRKPKPKDFRACMKAPIIVDARRIYDPEDFGELNYAAIGLGPVNPELASDPIVVLSHNACSSSGRTQNHCVDLLSSSLPW